MDIWKKRLEESPAWSKLTSLEEAMRGLEATFEGELDQIERLVRVRTEAEKRLKTVDPQLVSEAMLTSLDSALEQMLGALNTCKSQKAEGQNVQLTGVNARADGVLDSLADWPELAPSEEVDGLKDVAEDYRGRVGSLLHNLSEGAKQGEARLDELRSAVDDERSKSAAEVKKLTERIDSESQRVQELQVRLTSALDEYGAQFEKGQSDRRDAFAKLTEESQSNVAEMLASIEGKSSEALQAQGKSAAAVLERLEEFQEQAEEIVGLIARTGMAGGYEQDADQEEQRATVWRRIAIGFGLATALAAAMSLLAPVYVDLPIGGADSFFGRVAVTAAFAALATYGGKQSASHRRNARRSRSTQLALSSLGPYLQELQAEDRHAVIQAFAYRFFGRDEPHEKLEDSVAASHQFAEFVKRFRKAGLRDTE